MIDGRCKTCRHWSQGPYDETTGLCDLTLMESYPTYEKPGHPESKAIVEIIFPYDGFARSILHTDEDFGCTQWEEGE